MAACGPTRQRNAKKTMTLLSRTSTKYLRTTASGLYSMLCHATSTSMDEDASGKTIR